MISHPDLKFNLLAGNDVGLDQASPAENFIQCKSHDSTFGEWPSEMRVGARPDELILDTPQGAFPVQLFACSDPGTIPWAQAGVDGVAECTGVFRSRANDSRPGYDSHLKGGASRVALSAPAKDEVLTVVFGVHQRNLSREPLLSAASCTSGSLAFPLRVLLDSREDWGFSAGSIQTVHAYTAGEQGLQDRPVPITPGARRMFAAPVNIIPTTTGAASAIPKVDGIGGDMVGISFAGFALRVPVISGSLTLLQVVLENQPPMQDVLESFRNAAAGPMNGRFAVNEDPTKNPEGRPLVSSHIIRRPESSILDVEFSSRQGPLYTFPLWYGNEWGYVVRLIESLHAQCGE